MRISFEPNSRERLIPQPEIKNPEPGRILRERSNPQPEIKRPQRGMVWPLSGRITSMYGWRRGRHHDGISTKGQHHD